MNPQIVKSAIRTIHDFPKEGIRFRDITPVFEQPAVFSFVVETFSGWVHELGATALAGIDARGFLFAGAVAHSCGLPLTLVRKKGKLPAETLSQDYALEYGKSTLEVHRTGVLQGANVLVLDDLIATGGTALAAVKLVRQLGAATVSFGAVINLTDLPGAWRLREAGVDPHWICSFTEAE